MEGCKKTLDEFLKHKDSLFNGTNHLILSTVCRGDLGSTSVSESINFSPKSVLIESLAVSAVGGILGKCISAPIHFLIINKADLTRRGGNGSNALNLLSTLARLHFIHRHLLQLFSVQPRLISAIVLCWSSTTVIKKYILGPSNKAGQSCYGDLIQSC